MSATRSDEPDCEITASIAERESINKTIRLASRSREYRCSKASLIGRSSAENMLQKEEQRQALEVLRDGIKKAQAGGELSFKADPSV